MLSGIFARFLPGSDWEMLLFLLFSLIARNSLPGQSRVSSLIVVLFLIMEVEITDSIMSCT